jgi:integrase
MENASKAKSGINSLWPGVLLEKVIRPAVARAGISKRIGWHTFRHTYATLLVANGENVKVVQELMRHASTRFTLEIYSQAQLIAKRAAQQRLVEAILPEGVADSPPFWSCRDGSAIVPSGAIWSGAIILSAS